MINQADFHVMKIRLIYRAGAMNLKKTTRRLNRLSRLCLLMLLLTGCMANGVIDAETAPVNGAAGGDIGSINLVEVANLAAVTAVDVHKFDETSGAYLPSVTIDDPTTLIALIESLDQPLSLEPALFCLAAYELIFHFEDGAPLTFNYGCVAEEGGFLQGGDTPLGDHSIEPPPAFQELLSEQIDS